MELARQGDARGLDAIGATAFPEATAALLELSIIIDRFLICRLMGYDWASRYRRFTSCQSMKSMNFSMYSPLRFW
jgi:hypothetical protein